MKARSKKAKSASYEKADISYKPYLPTCEEGDASQSGSLAANVEANMTSGFDGDLGLNMEHGSGEAPKPTAEATKVRLGEKIHCRVIHEGGYRNVHDLCNLGA